MWYNKGEMTGPRSAVGRGGKMDKTNAAAFLNAYNKIDSQLRALYNYKASMSFTDIVRRSAEKNKVVRKYEDELTDFARLRNAIVHQSKDGKIIAVPCDEAVEAMQKIERLLCTPPTIGQTMREKKIVSVDDAISLKQALLLISRTGYSNLPVYRGKRMTGILNNRRIIRAMGEVIGRGEDLGAFAANTAVGEILEQSDLFSYYRYLGKKDTLQDILSAFENNRKLLAVLVSENGTVGERIENIVTASDLVAVNKILEDY